MKCRQCQVTIPVGYRTVEVGELHTFCSRKCRDEWLPARVLELEAALRRVSCISKGEPRKIAYRALVGGE